MTKLCPLTKEECDGNECAWYVFFPENTAYPNGEGYETCAVLELVRRIGR